MIKNEGKVGHPMEVGILWVLAFFSTSAHSLRLQEVKGLPVAPAKASGATEGFIRRRFRFTVVGGVAAFVKMTRFLAHLR